MNMWNTSSCLLTDTQPSYLYYLNSVQSLSAIAPHLLSPQYDYLNYIILLALFAGFHDGYSTFSLFVVENLICRVYCYYH